MLFLLPFTPPNRSKGSTLNSEFINEEMLYFINLAAALLAVDHVNNRNGDVVHDLALPNFEQCNISIPQFLVQDSSSQEGRVSPEEATTPSNFLSAVSSVLTEGRLSDYNLQTMPGFENYNSTLSFSESTGYRPCTIIGPSGSDDAIQLSRFLGDRNLEIPHISTHAVSHLLDNREVHPLFVRMITSSQDIAKLMLKYLIRIERDYIGVLYPSNMFGESIWNDLEKFSLQRNLTMLGFSFDESEIYSSGSSRLSIQRALEQLKETGFRTYVAIVDSNVQMEIFMDYAHKLGMNDDDYLWFLHGRETMFPGDASMMIAVSGSPLDQFVRGLGYISTTLSSEAFLSSLFAQNDTFLERAQLASPAKFGSKHYFAAPDDFFQQALYSHYLFSEAALIYDAVISAALGACKARSRAAEALDFSSEGISGAVLVDEIIKLDFIGATGNTSFDYNTKSRTLNSFSLTMFNGRAEEIPGVSNIQRHDLTLSSFTQGGDWVSVGYEPFVYSDGSSAPPLPLRWVYEKWSNGPAWILIVLFCVSAFGILECFICFSVVWVNRHSAIVETAEPSFLFMVCLLCLFAHLGVFLSVVLRIATESKATLDSVCSAIFVMNIMSMFLFVASVTLKLVWLYQTELRSRDVSFDRKIAKRILMSVIVLTLPAVIVSYMLAYHHWTLVVLETDEYGFAVEATGVCSFFWLGNPRGPEAMMMRRFVILILLSYLSFSGFIWSKIDCEARKSSSDEARSLFFAILASVVMLAITLIFIRLEAASASLEMSFFIISINRVLYGNFMLFFLVGPSLRALMRERCDFKEGQQNSYGMVIINWSRHDMISSLTDIFPAQEVQFRTPSIVKSDVSEHAPPVDALTSVLNLERGEDQYCINDTDDINVDNVESSSCAPFPSVAEQLPLPPSITAAGETK